MVIVFGINGRVLADAGDGEQEINWCFQGFCWLPFMKAVRQEGVRGARGRSTSLLWSMRPQKTRSSFLTTGAGFGTSQVVQIGEEGGQPDCLPFHVPSPPLPTGCARAIKARRLFDVCYFLCPRVSS